VTSCAYITVGTGIGVGLVINGAPVHGLMHPEGGHVMPARHPQDTYQGFTKLHPASVESMAAAKACAERCAVDPQDLPAVSDSHPAWDFVAYYIAQLCVSIMFMVSPHVIVLSGGIMQRHSLFPRIRKHFATLNDGYVNVPRIFSELDQYIVPSSFGDNCGIIGALELARGILRLP
jgi:fructokinase